MGKVIKGEDKTKMGKPYKSELAQLSETYKWVLSLDTAALEDQLRSAATCPLVVIGSGGSQSTAVLLADLHQFEFGQVSKADTPLIARHYLSQLRGASIVLVSGGGRNPDILGVARLAIECEPKSLILLCASKGSPLTGLVEAYPRGFCFDFELPTGKDGFLATNTLLALGLIALKGYGFGSDKLPPSLEAASETVEIFDRSELVSSISIINDTFFELPTIVVLYGSDGRAAATDLESKLVEAGLASVQLADYRNFAHGRHHWLAKHPDSFVVALASAREADLAKRTLALLPRLIPSLLVKTKLSGFASWIALQGAVFELVDRYGEVKSIDPGRPGVPEFGRRIYHLNAFRSGKKSVQAAAIERKMKAGGLRGIEWRQQLEEACSTVCKRISGARYNGLILDYDGTICDQVDRFSEIPTATAEALGRLTHAGFLLGVATGRGKSVREALQAAIPKSDWAQVWVGYYNGGVIARLCDNSEPNRDNSISSELQEASSALKMIVGHKLDLTVRPWQITIESRADFDVKELWSVVVRCLDEAGITRVKVVASTRSVDIIPENTTKLALLRALAEVQPNSKFLCIGDRPCWPGNDAELLSHEFSLSVDEVDGISTSVWNLAPAGVLGAAALRYYLSEITIGAKDFRIRLESQ